jgi:hypothetical protein
MVQSEHVDRPSSIVKEIRALGKPSIIAFPEHSYKRSPPNLMNFQSKDGGLKAWILGELIKTEVHCPLEGIEKFSNCWLIDGKYLINENGILIQETIADANTDTIFIESKKIIHNDNFISDVDMIAGLPLIHICKQGAANYGHFLIEIAPKLISAAKYFPDGFNVVLALEAQMFIPILKTLAAAMKLRLGIVVAPNGILFLNEIFYCTPVSKHNNRKSKTLIYQSNLLKDNKKSFIFNKRILVWRKQTDKRQIRNNEEILEFFIRRGFSVIYPAEMSFEQQILCFSNAEQIVGCLGAGLSNIAFCKKDTKIFMIDPGLYDFFFWDLSCVFDLEFNWYFAQPLEIFEIGMLTASYSIDLTDLRAALRRTEFIQW